MTSPELKLLRDLQKQISELKRMIEGLGGKQRTKTKVKVNRVPSKEEFHQRIESRMLKRRAA